MSRIIFITILIFAFCPAFLARENQPFTGDVFPPFDSFGKISMGDRKGRFDNFFVALRNDPEGKGVVIFRLDKKESKAKKRKRLVEISRHFNYRRIDKSRVKFIVYEDEEEFTELWVIPKKINWDDLLEILNIKNYKLIKGENFAPKKIDELFAKK